MSKEVYYAFRWLKWRRTRIGKAFAFVADVDEKTRYEVLKVDDFWIVRLKGLVLDTAVDSWSARVAGESDWNTRVKTALAVREQRELVELAILVEQRKEACKKHHQR